MGSKEAGEQDQGDVIAKLAMCAFEALNGFCASVLEREASLNPATLSCTARRHQQKHCANQSAASNGAHASHGSYIVLVVFRDPAVSENGAQELQYYEHHTIKLLGIFQHFLALFGRLFHFQPE